MDDNEQGRDRPDIDDESGTDAEESLALEPFILAIGDCATLVARLKERLDDHLGVSPDDVTWGHVADADRLLYHLRQAAFAAGVGEEPAS